MQKPNEPDVLKRTSKSESPHGYGSNLSTRGPQVLVLGSIYQGKPFWGYPTLFLTHSHVIVFQQSPTKSVSMPTKNPELRVLTMAHGQLLSSGHGTLVGRPQVPRATGDFHPHDTKMDVDVLLWASLETVKRGWKETRKHIAHLFKNRTPETRLSSVFLLVSLTTETNGKKTTGLRCSFWLP